MCCFALFFLFFSFKLLFRASYNKKLSKPNIFCNLFFFRFSKTGLHFLKSVKNWPFYRDFQVGEEFFFNCFLRLLIIKKWQTEIFNLLIFSDIFQNWFTFKNPLEIGCSRALFGICNISHSWKYIDMMVN